MTTLNINGQRVTVDDSFLKLSPDDQQATVDHIASSIGPQPDKYQQAASQDIAAAKASGADEGAGYTRRLAHGATLGADSTILAALQTPLEMMRRGTFSPAEGYNYAKAREDQIMGDARQNTGLLGDAAELVGGAATGGSLSSGASGLVREGGQLVARAGPQITATRLLGPDAGVLARSGAMAADSAALGGISGAMEGNGLKERAENAVKGAGVGALFGGALPLGGAVVRGVTAPIFANARARINPEGYGQAQIARAVHESELPASEIEQRVQQAAAEGQPQFTVADALGNPGQEMLGAAARGAGPARTQIVEALENRQSGQGRRIANTLSEGFNAPRTAAQTERAMTEARDTAANADYGAVRDDAQPIDVSNVVDHINQQVAPFGVAEDRLSPDGITARLLHYRRMLTSGRINLDGGSAGGINDFNAAQRVRQELADEVQTARQAGQGNRARLLGGVLRQLDTSLETASPGFREANANFAQRSRDIAQIGEGRAAALRGRTEDTIPAFQAQTPEGQQAFRVGYADPLIEAAQGSAQGVNKARPLMNDAFREEAAAMAPRGPLASFPINESEREGFLRRGFPHIVRTDAAALANAAERDMGGQPLIWSDAKANAVRNAGGAEGYPRIGMDRGRIGIEDGRHRIAVAGERGQGIDVAVRSPEEARALQQSVGGEPVRAGRMLRKIGREQTMFETRNTATGGSPTAKNLAHDAAMSVDPHLVGNVLSGNWHGAIHNVISAGHNALTGNTPAVRQAVANILLQNGANLSTGQLSQMVDRTIQRMRFVQNLARARQAVRQGAVVTTAEEAGAQGRR